MDSGTLVGGRYRAETVLGSGGFGETWRAKDIETGSHVALKVLKGGNGTGGAQALLREAAVLRGLAHPNIVKVLDCGTGEGTPFIALEHLPGPTLRQVIDEGGLDDAETSRIGAAVADALAMLHGAGLAHGDVKPENIILVSGEPVLADFGSARQLDETLEPVEFRKLAGTLAYLAPELLSGDAASPRGDVYALGVTLYELRSGQLPFARPGSAVTARARDVVPLRAVAPGASKSLEAALKHAASPVASARTASARTLSGELRGEQRTAMRRAFGRRNVVAAAVAAGLVMGGAGVFALSGGANGGNAGSELVAGVTPTATPVQAERTATSAQPTATTVPLTPTPSAVPATPAPTEEVDEIDDSERQPPGHVKPKKPKKPKGEGRGNR